MKQMNLSVTGFEKAPLRTRRRQFLEEMERVVPWAELVALIEPHAPRGGGAKGGRPPFGLQAMLRIHFLQQWYALSDPAMQEALHDIPMYRDFCGLDAAQSRLPDESTILKFRHLLEEHKLADQILGLVNTKLSERGLLLKEGTAIDATLIAAPSSTKNKDKARDPEMHQTKKGNQWYFGMKAHIGVDADSGLVHSVEGTAANVNDVTRAHALVHGQESVVFADAGYQGVEKREETQDIKVTWRVAMKNGKRKTLDKNTLLGELTNQVEKLKASVRAKVEHPFRVLKQQFGYVKVRYRGLEKNTAQIKTLFALVNLWLARKPMMALTG
jgi:IS5 family transposase